MRWEDMSLFRGRRILKQTLCLITDSFLAQLSGISRGNINSGNVTLSSKELFVAFFLPFSQLKVF